MSEESPLKAVQVKLVLLGEAAVGKSSLVLRFVSNDFNDNTSPTIGAAFLTQKCRLENRIVKFEIWDTAGQERFHSLAPMYYRNAAAAVVVYDITKSASLEKAKAWVKELQRQANPNIVIALVGNKLDLVEGAVSATPPSAADGQGESDNPAVELSAVAENGTAQEEDASDSAPSSTPATPVTDSGNDRQVSREEAASYADECGLLFFEASAKTGANVGEVFTEIAKTIPLDVATPKPAPGAQRSTNAGQGPDRVNLGEGSQAKKTGCC